MSRMSEAFQGDIFSAPKKQQTTEIAGLSDVPEIVREHFERLTLQVAARGIKHYSADAILHQIRWHHHIEKGDREFTCSNNWTAPLARWFMQKHPEHDGIFQTKNRPSLQENES